MSVIDTVKTAFDFKVEKLALTGPNNARTPWFGLFRSSDGLPVGPGSVTDRYLPHQTEDVVALVEAAQAAFDGGIEAKCHFRNGHYVLINPTADYRREVFGTADNIFPRLLIDAAYGSSFVANMGYYRDVCKNMHIMQSVSETSAKIRHTAGLRPKMDELVVTFGRLKQSWESLTETIRQMQSHDVQMPNYLSELYPLASDASQNTVTRHQNRLHSIYNRLNRDRAFLGKPSIATGDYQYISAWDAFNAVQGFEQHDTTRRAGFSGDFDRMLLAVNEPVVKAAERLALAA